MTERHLSYDELVSTLLDPTSQEHQLIEHREHCCRCETALEVLREVLREDITPEEDSVLRELGEGKPVTLGRKRALSPSRELIQKLKQRFFR